jgi:excisionase family DNA binding protein
MPIDNVRPKMILCAYKRIHILLITNNSLAHIRDGEKRNEKPLSPLSYFSSRYNPMALGDEWPDLLTVREVAKILRVSPLTIKRWGKRGKLPAIRINSRGDRRYKKEAVLWLLGLQQKGEV